MTPAEFTMYQQNPLCYFANIEEMYGQAFIDQPSDQTAQRKRTVDAPQAKIDTPAADAAKRDVDEGSKYAYLFETVFPWHIWKLHMAEPSVTGSATAVVVSTTSCAGLDGINGGTGVVTSFRQLEVVQTTPPTPINAATPSAVPVAASAAERLVPRIPLMLTTVVWFGSWARSHL